MIAYFFDIEERRIADSTIFETFLQETNSDGDTLTVRGFGFPENAEYVGFFDREADFQLYHIVTAKENEITHELSLYCEIDLYELVTEKTITDIRPTNTTAGFALEQVLKGTRFEVGNVASSILASTRFYYCSPFTALRRIESIWGVRAKVRYNIRGSRIANRYVDLVSAAPIWRGKRFEIGKDILSAEFTVDKRNVVTALIGRGKGESVGDGYGRRISFSDVVWSKANGDPADKPAGQEWIEDPEATALYGVCGKNPRFSVIEFDEIEDPEELLIQTWNALQDACAPLIYGSLSSVALDAMGFPHEAAHYGDEAAFITSGRRLRAQIVGVKRDYTRNDADEFQFGALTDSSARQIADVKREISTTKDKANAGAQVAQKNESLLQGYIDTMKTQILSTGTKLYTDQYDGGLVLESADGKSAVKLTGSGILIASTKTGDDFQWTLAIDGRGAVADTITTGVLNASIVKIFGTSAFYWDSANIHIVNPEDTNRQIRIGLYDGAHYGIGFTTDGGQTWQNAIGFNGVSFSSGSVTMAALSQETIDEINAHAKKVAEEEAKAAKDAADAAAQAAADAQGKADAAAQTAAEAQSKANAAKSEVESATAAANAAQDAANAAEAEAVAAAGIAANKGRVWFQTEAPEGNENDLWIDTTNNANTPKRWNGESWVAVTDKAAVNAANAAANAKGTADAAAQAAADAQNAADAAQGAADAAQGAADAAQGAADAAQGTADAAAQAAADAQAAAEKAKGDVDALGKTVTTIDQRTTPTSIVSTVRESTEYKGDLNAMVKQTTFEQNARDVTAIFNRIGLDGAQTGIVKADIDGVKVSHSDFNGYTQQAKDGFKMYDGNGNLIGGMFVVNGTAISGVQRLLNPSRTTFFVEVSPGLYADEEDGLRFYYGNAVCGILTGIWDSDGDGNGSMRLRANDTLYIGDKNGQLSVLDLIKSVNRVHFSYSQPSSANAGDIWLKPINID